MDDERGAGAADGPLIDNAQRWYLRVTSRPPETPTGEEWLDADGALGELARPAAYLDSSALIEYWRTEEIQLPELGRLADGWSRRLFDFLFRTGKGLDRVAEARDMVLSEETGLSLITSPVALMELQSWASETAMLHLLSEAAGAKNVKQRRHKEVGELLRMCWDARRADDTELREAVDMVAHLSVIGPSWSHAHGLAGVYLASLRGFNLSVDDYWSSTLWLMSYLQVGAADVLHACFAEHLGCKYFVSFDGDFRRVREEMRSEMGLELICTPQELVDALRRHPPAGEDRE